jgi:hypothetical protein
VSIGSPDLYKPKPLGNVPLLTEDLGKDCIPRESKMRADGLLAIDYLRLFYTLCPLIWLAILHFLQ